jgi:hypothetical protein
MTPLTCAQVRETYEGPNLGSGNSGDLADHLAKCDACAELVTAQMIAAAHADAEQSAQVPSAGQVWWRAQVRARAEARRAAERPIHVIQAVAAAVVAGALAAGIGWVAPWIKQTAFWETTAALGFAWWLAIGAWLILAPVALYLVFARE